MKIKGCDRCRWVAIYLNKCGLIQENQSRLRKKIKKKKKTEKKNELIVLRHKYAYLQRFCKGWNQLLQ